MKKNNLTLLLLFAVSFAFAQSNYGFRAGVNISNLDFEGEGPKFIPSDNTHRNGVAFGFFADFHITETISIMPEVQWSAEGAKGKDLRIGKINFPVMVRFVIGDDFKIGVGPQMNHETEGFEKGLRNFAFSGIVGVEYMLNDQFFVDARYNYGFTNIYQDDAPFEAIGTHFQFGIGVKVY